ncbi:hypothetical protein HAX54_049964, partial [Datura stramonium]|nr:hypothetical protein [Datura stramonium]
KCHAGGFGKLLEPDMCASSWYLQTISASAGELEGTHLQSVDSSLSHTSAPGKYWCQYK